LFELRTIEAIAREAGASPGEARAVTARVRGARDVVPMSFAQEVIWLLDRATPGMVAYNVPMARRVRGPLDVVALGRALTAVAAPSRGGHR